MSLYSSLKSLLSSISRKQIGGLLSNSCYRTLHTTKPYKNFQYYCPVLSFLLTSRMIPQHAR